MAHREWGLPSVRAAAGVEPAHAEPGCQYHLPPSCNMCCSTLLPSTVPLPSHATCAGAMFMSGQKAAHVALNALRRQQEGAGAGEGQEEEKPLVAA